MTEEQTTEEQESAEKLRSTIKKNFDPRERLRKRGLRRATITLYLDEDTGDLLGRDYPLTNSVGAIVGRDRVGVLGDIANLEDEIAATVKDHNAAMEDEKLAAAGKGKLKRDHASYLKEAEKKLAELFARRDELIEELEATSITFKLRAVPPVIRKDCHRKAKKSLGIETKGVPEDLKSDVNDAEVAHLLAVMTEQIIDNESGVVNEGIDYHDAVAFMEELPPSQWTRLDQKVGELQFTDAISRSIEKQEDFS